MLLFKTKLPFASIRRSTWRHCASVALYIAVEGATVQCTSQTQMLQWAPEFYHTGTVWFVLHLDSHICSIKPTYCQNNPAKSIFFSLCWMHLHQFQYLSVVAQALHFPVGYSFAVAMAAGGLGTTRIFQIDFFHISITRFTLTMVWRMR